MDRAGRSGIPRASGGVSSAGTAMLTVWLYSPRKRGCFHRIERFLHLDAVFPAQAGVFPSAASAPNGRRSIPRASGGVSKITESTNSRRMYSPRKRGVSTHLSPPLQTGWYSPRKRGCFRHGARAANRFIVFPAQAGVFPSTARPRRSCFSIPRASGGVSQLSSKTWAQVAYSPRKRGCFRIGISRSSR